MDRNTQCQKLVNTLLKSCNQQESFLNDWVVIKSVVTPNVCYTIYQHIGLTTFVVHINKDLAKRKDGKMILSKITLMAGDWMQDEENPYMWFLEKINTRHESEGTHTRLDVSPPKTVPSLTTLKDKQARELKKLQTSLIWESPSSEANKTRDTKNRIKLF